MSDSLLPITSTPLAKALDVLEQRLFDLPVQMISKDPQTVSVALLDHLAWENSVDVWDVDWPEDAKRSAVALAVELHRFKGTPYAIRRALQVFDLRVELEEWRDDATISAGEYVLTVYNAESDAGGGALVADADFVSRLETSMRRVGPISRKFQFRIHDDFKSSFHVSPSFGDLFVDDVLMTMELP